MRRLLAILAVATAGLGASPAQAADGDPMPLADVRPGMQCTGYSVFRGTAVEPFGVEVVDVVGESAGGGSEARLLVRVSGPAIEATGVGYGFSGSPIYCPAADGTLRNAGAISELVGEFGGRMVLATPIEQVLGTPVDPPTGARRVRRPVTSLSGPLTVGGLRPALMRGLTRAAAERGVTLLAAAPVPADGIPPQRLVPGSAVGVGLSSGDLTVGATGTVAYVRGDDVWAFGHPFDGAGARSLLLQDAYVSAIVNNPIASADGTATYKLAGAVNDIGTITSDGFSAVAGRMGVFPQTVFVRTAATDTDTGAVDTSTVRVADETDLGNPVGATALSFVAPLALADTATGVLGAAPARGAATMCVKLRLRERRAPLRFCNRYVSDGSTPGDGGGSNPVAQAAALDASLALGLLDTYKGSPAHPLVVTQRIRLTRAQRQAYLRSVELPARVRRGTTVRGTFVAQVVRGAEVRMPFRWRVPKSLKRGKREVRFRGTDPDYGGAFFDTITIELGGEEEVYDSEGPRDVEAVAAQFAALHRYDGITARRKRVFRHPTYRVGGEAVAKLRVR